MPYYPPQGAGGSSNSGGLAGTGFYYVVGSSTPGLPISKILSAGNNISLTTDTVAMFITAITGVAAASGGLMGTGNFLVTWSSDPLISNEKILTAGSSITITTDSTAIYITAITPGVAASSGGLMGTGGFFVGWSSDTTMSNERVLTAGSSVTLVTDATTIWINALTSGGSGTPGGSDSQIQVNSQNAFAGFSNLRWVSSSNSLDLNTAGRIRHGGVAEVDGLTPATVTGLVWLDTSVGSVSFSSSGLASTGGCYLVWSDNGTLFNEEVFSAGTGLSINTSGTSFVVASEVRDDKYYLSFASNTATSLSQSFYAGAGYDNSSALGTQAMSINTMTAVHFFAYKNIRVDSMAMLATVTGAGALVRLGIYTNSADNVLQPFQLVSSSGVLVCTPNILSQFQVNETLSANNLYWFILDIGTAAVTTRSIPLGGGYSILGLDSGLGASIVALNSGKLFGTGFPATFGPGWGPVKLASIPLLAIRPSL